MEQEEQYRPPHSDPDRTWALFCHLGALSIYIGVPLGHILVPLLLWLIKREESPRVDEHGKASLNFQISITAYALLAAVAYVVLLMTWFVVTAGPPVRALFLLIPFVFAVFIVPHLLLTILASIRAGNGQLYRYPLTIPFFK